MEKCQLIVSLPQLLLKRSERSLQTLAGALLHGKPPLGGIQGGLQARRIGLGLGNRVVELFFKLVVTRLELVVEQEPGYGEPGRHAQHQNPKNDSPESRAPTLKSLARRLGGAKCYIGRAA